MCQGLLRSHTILWVYYKELLQKVDHLRERVVVLVRLQLQPKIETFRVDVDRLLRLKGRLTRADEEHDAAKRPRVNLEVSVLLISRLWRRPFS